MAVTQRVSVDEIKLSADTPLPVAIASGGNVDIGTKADTAVTDPTDSASVIAALKGLLKRLTDGDGSIRISIGGVAPQLDSTDRIAISLYGKDSAAGDTPITADSSGNLKASLGTALSSSIDSIDTAKKSKGSTTLNHNAIPASVAEGSCTAIDCTGHDSIEAHCVITEAGPWTLAVYGCPTSNGTFVSKECDNNAVQRTGITSSVSCQFPVGGSKYVKLVPTLAGGGSGTLTVNATPFNF